MNKTRVANKAVPLYKRVLQIYIMLLNKLKYIQIFNRLIRNDKR